MDTGIDFLLQDLLGALDSQRCHLLTQGFTGSNGLLVGFSAGSSNNLVAFFCRTGLGFFNDGLGAAFGIRKPRSCFVARLGQFLLDALVDSGQFGLGLVGSSEAIGDFLGSLIQCLRDRGPHELHREQRQNQENTKLNEQGRVNTHGNTFLFRALNGA